MPKPNRRSFALKVTVLAVLALLLGVGCEQVSPAVFWPAVFGAFTVPAMLILVGLLLLYWLRRNWRVAALLGVLLALLWPQVQRGLALHPFFFASLNEELGMKNEELGAAARPGTGPATVSPTAVAIPHSSFLIPHSKFLVPHSKADVTLLSANVRIFNVYAQLRDADNHSSKAFIDWLAESPADILCLQEFYHEPQGSRENGDVFRAAQRIGPAAGRQAFVSKSLTNRIGAEFGLAIFSRYPIVRKGVIRFGKLTQNHAMWADVARPARPGARPDTIRVFNLHLQSMSLAEADIVAAATTEAGLRQKAAGLLRRFRNGAVARAHQTDTLVARLARSPYPVLLAGDLNDLPYSYAYDQLADRLQNAWASTGTGLGATYHGRLPGLRIDQQFASPDWQILGCRVHREILWSDHFPVEAVYRLRRP